MRVLGGVVPTAELTAPEIVLVPTEFKAALRSAIGPKPERDKLRVKLTPEL